MYKFGRNMIDVPMKIKQKPSKNKKGIQKMPAEKKSSHEAF